MGDLLGKTDKKAIKSQERQNELTRSLIREYGDQARSDVFGLFPSQMDTRRQGVQGALNVFGQTIPQQLSAFQQGNVGAQTALLGGLPQMNNAILGLPVDYSAMQPTSIPYNTDFTQQQLPPFSMPGMTGMAPDTGTNIGSGNYPVPTQSAGNATDLANFGERYNPTVPGGEGASFGSQGFSMPPVTWGGGATSGRGYGNASNLGGTGGSGSSWNPFADTYNASPIDQLFGRNDIGSLAQLGLSERGGSIGRIAGLLGGIPGLGFLGNYLGNQNIANKTWMNPVNPVDPYSSLGSGMALLNDALGTPNSPVPSGGGVGSSGGGFIPGSAWGPLASRIKH